MSDNKQMSGEELLLFLWRQIYHLQAAEIAMARIMFELAPSLSPEVLKVVHNYQKYKAEEGEKLLLSLEVKFPGLAAELDKERPLLPPNDKGNPDSPANPSTL